MSTNQEWTRVHDLALVYLALAYGTDYELTDKELSRITERLQEWQEGTGPVQETHEVVLEAMSIYLTEHASGEVAHAIESLGQTLSEEERERVLTDIVHIAEADGIMLTNERGLISVLASVWGLRSAGQRLLDASTAPVEDRRAWSLLHDISLIYLVLAHSTDAELHEAEIGAMIERLGDWRPEFDEEQLRHIIRGALEVYAGQPDEAVLSKSVSAIRSGLSFVQRLVLLDDLVYIAEIDGTLDDREKELISTLAKVWQVGIRLNGQAARVSDS